MAVDTDTVRGFYLQYLGRDPGANEYVQNWANSGMSAAEIETAIANSEEAQQEAQRRAQQGQQAGTTTGVSRERLNQLYNELFGRDVLDAGAEYWMASGLTGEKLRNALIAGAQGSDITDFAERQAMLAAGQIPAGYPGSPLGGGTTETVPAYFQDYLNEYNAMQERLDTLTALIEQMQNSSAPVSTATSIGQPGGTPTNQGATVIDDTGVYSSVGPAYQSSQDVAAAAFNPYRTPVAGANLTPEMIDAYRFQQFYTQAPSLVPRIDQGVGSLSYFGIPPSRIQASLSGF
jgi:hypothetical protein